MDFVINKILDKLKEDMEKKDITHFFFGKPDEIDEVTATAGMIYINPITTEINSLTTGMQDQDTFNLEIGIIKKTTKDMYKNPKKESVMSFLVRIMEGRDPQNVLKTNTIRYIVRNQMRQFGSRQDTISIEYDTKEYGKEDIATAKMNLKQIGITNQPIA